MSKQNIVKFGVTTTE